MIDIQVVYDKLCTFETANDLADHFKSLGIQGVEQDALACPITKYVKMETGLVNVVTNSGYVTVAKENPDHYDAMNVLFQGKNTDAMTDFVQGFDHGRYPDLVEPETPWWEFPPFNN